VPWSIAANAVPNLFEACALPPQGMTGDATMNDAQLQEVEDVYRELRQGVGHEHVTDGNVDALVRRAEQDGHTILAQELREWKASCAPRSDAPNTTRAVKS
jgi:hypothetical protein